MWMWMRKTKESWRNLPAKAGCMKCLQAGKAHIVEALKRHIGARDSAPKEKAVVMFIKNSFDEGYVNGTLGVVEDFDNSGARRLSGHFPAGKFS